VEVAVHRHRLASLPPLHSADVALHIGSNFLPGIEPIP
jgi:hypothetical protein